jgi:hypothetical protein
VNKAVYDANEVEIILCSITPQCKTITRIGLYPKTLKRMELLCPRNNFDFFLFPGMIHLVTFYIDEFENGHGCLFI